ncbi:MAG: hypothetical protein RIC55_20150 [Pirellulaceae bacterium]
MPRHANPLLALLLGLVCATAARAETKSIKVYRVGSSSFSYALIEDTRAIVEASGDYQLICDAGDDQAGYTRLDQFLTQPGLFEEWCSEQIPRIKAGGYDYVIIQTIGWLNFTPPDQDKLCAEIIPELARRIRATGAEVILYDKYLPLKFDQKDPRARTWCLRYPEGYKLNYLLHIAAARQAGIRKISFGGEAVTRLWQQPPFSQLGFLYCDPGHPGPMANYLSAVNLAYLLTGEDPLGSPVRELPLGEGRLLAFNKLTTSGRPGDKALYDANKDRIRGERVILRDEEARLLQQAGMESQRKWGAILQANLNDADVFADTLREIKRLQAEMDKFEQYGLDPGTVAALKASYAPAASPGELTPALLAKIRRKSRSIEYAGVDIRNYYRKFLSREQQRHVQEAYEQYWLKHNSKLRDDLYFQCWVEEEKALRDGRRDDAEKYHAAVGMLRNVLSFAAYRLLLEEVNDRQRNEILTAYTVTGPTKRNAPRFAAYQNEHHLDQQKLLAAWEVYLSIWADPDRMDQLRENDFALDAFQQADQEFARRAAQ